MPLFIGYSKGIVDFLTSTHCLQLANDGQVPADIMVAQVATFS